MSDRPPHAPRLSVVVAASASAGAVASALASLDPGACEVIVAAAADRVAPTEDLPEGVVRVTAPAGTGVPRLRRLGLERARCEVVVFTEDSCAFAPGWAAEWVEAFADPLVRAAGGPVVPAMGDRVIDRAVFACEYAVFLPAAADSAPPARLAGNNFAVRRHDAGHCHPFEIHEGDVAAWPGRTHFAGSVRLVPRAVAGHARSYPMTDAIRDRLRFGFGYGRRRASGVARAARPAGLVIGPAVWVVQSARLCKTLLRRPRHLGDAAECLPVTLALLAAWSAGEWLGWLAALFSATTWKSGPTRRAAL